MHVRIGQTVELVDPADLTRFHASCPTAFDEGELRAVLAREKVGDLLSGDHDHIMVRIDAIRRLAAGQVGSTWEEEFRGMLDYAERKGWLSAGGTSVQAHLVREDH
jgi:hypothetical protein